MLEEIQSGVPASYRIERYMPIETPKAQLQAKKNAI